MATIITSLNSSGILKSNVGFDEVSSLAGPEKIKVSANTVNAVLFDEVTMTATGSISFNGASQYLTFPSNAAFAFGTGDFTVECWVYKNIASNQQIFINFGSGGMQFYTDASQLFTVTNSTVAILVTSSIAITLNTWNHLAVSRSGTSLKIFVNGVQAGSVTNSTNWTQTAYSTGSVSGDFINGYISNLRIVKGTALYTATFIPPGSPLSAITNTSLLLNNYKYAPFLDSSVNNFTVTLVNSPTANTSTPFSTVPQRILQNGNMQVSGYFDEFTGIPIADSSLKLWLDAGQTASYPGTGTTWTDLSGNGNTGTLTNGPTFSSINGGSLIFVESSSQYVNCNLSLNVAYYSVSWWIKPSNVVDYNQQIALQYNYTGTNTWGGFLFHTTSNGSVYVGTSVGSRISPWRSNVVVLNIWQNFTWTFNNGAAIFYKNGIVETSATLAISTLPSFTNLVTNPNGSLSTINVYNRAISADEVAQNFNALRGRYGI